MSGRKLIPDDWAPARGAHVTLLPAPDSAAPPGVWRILDRAPDGWWIQPADAAARGWAAGNATQLLQGCLVLDGRVGVAGRRMLPAYLQTAMDP